MGFPLVSISPFLYFSSLVLSDNLKLTRDNPEVLRQKIQSEVALGRIVGSFPDIPSPNLKVSPLGVIPKKEPGKFWLI